MPWFETECPACQVPIYWEESAKKPTPQPLTCTSEQMGGPRCDSRLPMLRPIPGKRKPPVWTRCAYPECPEYFWTKGQKRYHDDYCYGRHRAILAKQKAVADGLEGLTHRFAPVPEQDAWIRAQAQRVRTGEIPVHVDQRAKPALLKDGKAIDS